MKSLASGTQKHLATDRPFRERRGCEGDASRARERRHSTLTPSTIAAGSRNQSAIVDYRPPHWAGFFVGLRMRRGRLVDVGPGGILQRKVKIGMPPESVRTCEVLVMLRCSARTAEVIALA